MSDSTRYFSHKNPAFLFWQSVSPDIPFRRTFQYKSGILSFSGIKKRGRYRKRPTFDNMTGTERLIERLAVFTIHPDALPHSFLLISMFQKQTISASFHLFLFFYINLRFLMRSYHIGNCRHRLPIPKPKRFSFNTFPVCMLHNSCVF